MHMKIKAKFIIITAVILVVMGSVYYKLHIVVQSDLLKIQDLELKSEQIKDYINMAEEKLEVQKEGLSMMKAEIQKYGSGAITESNSTEALMGSVYHPTNAQYEKLYDDYVFKKKVLYNKKDELSKNQKELDELKKEVSRLKLFK